MNYDEKYDAMPLRGKISPGAWEMEHMGIDDWGESTRRHKRKLHRHYDPYNDWWSRPMSVGWSYKGKHISKGYKRKTWRDYR